MIVSACGSMLVFYTLTEDEIIVMNRALYCQKSKTVYAVSLLQYSKLGELSVGPVSYTEEDGKPVPLVICKDYYRRGNVELSDKSYDIDAQTEKGVLFYLHLTHVFGVFFQYGKHYFKSKIHF